MFKDFYVDMKEYKIKNKWMKFDFYFRQPFGLLGFLAVLAVLLFRADGRIGRLYTLAVVAIIIINVLLLYLTFLREKYSYHCWIALQVLDMFLSIPYKDFSIWGLLVPVVFLILLVLYYRNRRDFFYRERVEEDCEDKKRKLIIGGFLSVMAVIFVMATLMYGMHKRYMEKPAKTKEYISSVTEDTWTEEETEALASGWITAVEGKNTEKIQKIIEEIYVERERSQSFLFLKQTEFQAGIDQEKSDKMLSYIDAKDHGMAYYSLARISHYYDARTSQNHEMMVSVQEKEEGIYAVLQHGKSKTEIDFIDMNEVVGEAGKDHFRNLEFSEEEIVSLLSNVYTDKDISFVKELAETAGEEEYTQLLQNNPDELSAYGQDALYSYAYGLMDCGIEYELDSSLTVTNQDFEQLQSLVNSILRIRSGKKRYYCERYLKILEDKGKVHMNDAADQLRLNYDQKEKVINLLPEFAYNAQLNILFKVLIYRLNDAGNIKSENTMQIENTGIRNSAVNLDSNGNLLLNNFCYKEVIKKNNEVLMANVELDKYTGNETLLIKEYTDSDTTNEEDLWISLYGDVIVCKEINGKKKDKIIAQGAHDANAILKSAWLENKGLSWFVNEDLKDSISQVIDQIMLSDKPDKEELEMAQKMHLLWEGMQDKNIDMLIENIDASEISSGILHLQEMVFTASDESFSYTQYNIINDYYFD